MNKVLLFLSLTTFALMSSFAEAGTLRACFTYVTYSDIENAQTHFVGYGIDDYEACSQSRTQCRTYQYRRNQIGSKCITTSETVEAQICRAHLVVTEDNQIIKSFLAHSLSREEACNIAVKNCKNYKHNRVASNLKCRVVE